MSDQIEIEKGVKSRVKVRMGKVMLCKVSFFWQNLEIITSTVGPTSCRGCSSAEWQSISSCFRSVKGKARFDQTLRHKS